MVSRTVTALYDRYARARGRVERWARLHGALPRRDARLAWDLFWHAHHRWWTRDERAGEMGPTGDPVELPIPKERSRRVLVRPGTTDALVYYDCLVDRQYTRPLSDIAGSVRTVLDAGGNVGMASIAFLSECPHARVLTIECDPVNAAVARENLRQYGDRVELLEAALWHERAAVSLAGAERGTWASHVVPTASGSVPTHTPDECIDRLGGTGIDIVKIDIEGAEIPLFSTREAGRWAARVHHQILVEPETAESASIIRHTLTSHWGFHPTYAYRDVVGYTRAANA